MKGKIGKQKEGLFVGLRGWRAAVCARACVYPRCSIGAPAPRSTVMGAYANEVNSRPGNNLFQRCTLPGM